MHKPGSFRKVAFLPTLAAMMLAASVTHADVVEQDEEARSPYPKPQNPFGRPSGGKYYSGYNTTREQNRRVRQRIRQFYKSLGFSNRGAEMRSKQAIGECFQTGCKEQADVDGWCDDHSVQFKTYGTHHPVGNTGPGYVPGDVKVIGT